MNPSSSMRFKAFNFGLSSRSDIISTFVGAKTVWLHLFHVGRERYRAYSVVFCAVVGLIVRARGVSRNHDHQLLREQAASFAFVVAQRSQHVRFIKCFTFVPASRFIQISGLVYFSV